ncbi:MAG: PAS domain-containing protein [Kineosporiaceae bacterium]
MDEGVQDGEGGVDGEWPPGDAAGCPRVESSLRALDAAGVLGATFLTGDGGRIVWVSRRFVELTGFDEAQALGRRRGELIAGPFVGSDGFRELEAALVEGRPCALEFPTRTATGRAYWAALELAAVDAGSAPSALCEGCPGCAEGEAGRLVALVGRERDVTAQRLAEERARQALSRAQSLGVALRLEKQLLTSVLGGVPQLVWWKGSDGRYLGCNPSFLRARGLTSLADVIGRLESQLDVHDDLGRQVAEAEAEVGAGRAASVDVPVTLTMADESTVSLLVTISGATAAAGQATPVLPVQPSRAGAIGGAGGWVGGAAPAGRRAARSAPGLPLRGAP